MNELSLFSGAGGGLLGSILLGWRTIGYVEWDEYCQRVIVQRIKDGFLHEAPIFSDVNAFISEGYAASYTGMVDVLTAGFPCQPFSVAGRHKGANDEKNMWPQTIDTIRIVQPRYVLLENVPGIRSYLPVVIRDLRRFGYYVHPPIDVAAADVGANHLRVRIWIMAHHDCSCNKTPEQQVCPGGNTTELCSQAVANTSGNGLERPIHTRDCESQGRRIESRGETARRNMPTRTSHWRTEPRLDRLVDGVPNWMDRLEALGNAQVPAVVRAAWEILGGL